MLPHAYPFRLLDRDAEGGVGVLVSGNAALARGGAELPALLAVEVLAQAALVALPAAGGEGAPRGGLLAGLEAVRFHHPLWAGDRLTASATLLARFGTLVKVRATLRRGETTVVEGDLLLALE